MAQNAQDKAPSWDFRLLASADHGIVGEDNLFFDAEVTQGDERDYRYHYTWVNDADPTEIGDDTERERSTFGFIAPHVGDFTLTCVVRRVSDDGSWGDKGLVTDALRGLLEAGEHTVSAEEIPGYILASEQNVQVKVDAAGAMPGEDFVEIGRDMEESEKAVKYLQDAGYDMLNCDNGTYDAWYWAHPPQYMPQNCNLEDVEHIKQFVDIPVVCAGRMQPAVGAEAIRDGKIDAMAVGRQFLADPHWVTKLIRGHEEDIRPCICCHTACFNLTKHNGSANDQDLSESAGMCHCAVNPISMQSKKYYIRPAKKQKTVAVIGGGIGGMEAARILTLRGHKAVIYEKSDCLGGIFIAAAAPEFKEKDKELISWFKHQIDKLGIEVHLNTEVTPEDIPEADEIIVATGAAPNRIPIPGASEYAMDATEYLLGEKEVGDNVVIIGGGLTGCEIALDLFRKGKHPAIVEMKDDLIAVKNMCLANTSYLRDCFKTNKVPVYLNAGVKNISETEVSVQTKDEGIVTLPADNVIMSVGYHPMPLKEASKHIHLLGDCSKVGNVRSVIWGAWDIAMKI